MATLLRFRALCLPLLIRLSTVAPSLVTPPGVTRVKDSVSRRPVLLVGTMHYNPHSVAIVRGTIRAAARRHGLHATAIELCPSRWNSTCAARWQTEREASTASYEQLLSEDEFQVAWESAVACGLSDVVLADQEIATTGRRFAAALLGTPVLLLTPAGWRRVAADLRTAGQRLPTFAGAALHGKLLAGVPLAVARYLYQSPAALPFVLLSAAALAVAAAVDEATGAVATWDDGAVAAAVTLVLGRAVFVSLIDERDRVLARNIRDACLQPPQAEAEASTSATSAVVAVIGMAHLAGVREALGRPDI